MECLGVAEPALSLLLPLRIRALQTLFHLHLPFQDLPMARPAAHCWPATSFLLRRLWAEAPHRTARGLAGKAQDLGSRWMLAQALVQPITGAAAEMPGR